MQVCCKAFSIALRQLKYGVGLPFEKKCWLQKKRSNTILDRLNILTMPTLPGVLMNII